MAKLNSDGNTYKQQLSSSELKKLSKHLEELVAKSKKLKVADAFKKVGKDLSALELKVANKGELDTSLTDNLGELLYSVGDLATLSGQSRNPCSSSAESSSQLANDLNASALAVLALGNSIKPPKDQSSKNTDMAKILAAVEETRCAAENVAEAMVMTAADLLAANGNIIESIHIPALGPSDKCGCVNNSPNDTPSLINLAVPVVFVPETYDVEPIGVSLEGLTEVLEQLLHFITLLAILLSIMPAVGCTNNCTEGALRATMTAHGSLANGTSTFTIKWEYCCLEACFLWITGTYWDDAGSTNHTAGTPLGNNRRTAATRRAKSVGTAAATWLSTGGALPGVVRRNRITPALIAPTSTC